MMSSTFEVKVIAVGESRGELKMFHASVAHPAFKIYLNISLHLV